MIIMVISDESEKERQYIVQYSRDMAVNMVCVDITVENALDMVKEIRKDSPSVYIILIASQSISPLIYMRPAIGAESLLLRPLSKTQIKQVLAEAICTYAERFYKPEERKEFLVESRGERSLIAYGRICFFEARDKRVYLNTETEEYGFYGTLDKLEEQLEGEFLRCHRSFLVNKDKIAGVYLSQNRLVLKGDLELPLSRTYKPAVREYLKKGGAYSEGSS